MKKKPLLTWTSHPLVDFPATTVLLIALLFLVSIVLFKMTVLEWKTPLYFYLGMTILIGNLLTWFIPTTYNLYPEKIIIFYAFIKVERNWDDFHCWYADRKGVQLSTFHRPRRLDSFRGQSLRFSKDKSEKEELYKILEERAGNKY